MLEPRKYLLWKAYATQVPDIRTEFLAGLGTYLTLSYIFLLNPVLLNKAGVDLSQAFAGTILSAAIATLAMAFYAKLPFAVAPAPSITTFFVSFVVLSAGLSWQAAMIAVIISGILSVVLALLSVRAKIVEAIPAGLRVALLFALCGFLVANGLMQAKLIAFPDGALTIGKGIPLYGLAGGVAILITGLATTLLLKQAIFRFTAAPVVGILLATLVCTGLGLQQNSKVVLSLEMFKAPVLLGNWIASGSWIELLSSSAFVSIVVFVIIDFFGGIGKFVALFSAVNQNETSIDPERLKKSLNVDGMGSIVGGAIGAGSLAVFVSSAVGIAAGGKTGLTSIFTSLFILASFLFIPLVGSIPVEATSGILVYVGFLLVPFSGIIGNSLKMDHWDSSFCVIALLVSFYTFTLDISMLLLFSAYSIKLLIQRQYQSLPVLGGTALLLLSSQIFQRF